MELDDLAAAQAAVATLLSRLTADDWARATPCEDWDVAAVVRHVVVGDRAFVTSLGGTAYHLPTVAAEVAGVGPADLPATYDAGGVRLREALAVAPDGPTFPTGIGPMTTAQIAELRTIEALAHGWDLGRSTGRVLEVDDALAERAVDWSRALMERLPPDRTPFGAPQEVDRAAPALDRLAALLGRPPGWVRR